MIRIRETDISEANKTYPRSFGGGVVVHGVCYRVHHRKSKERRSLQGQWICSRKRMTRRTREGTGNGGWTEPHLRSGSSEWWWWTESTTKLFCFIYSLYCFINNQIMSPNVKRPDPEKSVLLLCDIQTKFSERFSREKEPRVG